MGYMGGVAAASSVIQANLKILLHKRLKGPDAEDVWHYCFVYDHVIIHLLVSSCSLYTSFALPYVKYAHCRHKYKPLLPMCSELHCQGRIFSF